MWDMRNSLAGFAAVAAPAVLAILALVGLVHYGLNAMAEHTNLLDRQRSADAAQAAMHSLSRNVEQLANDNAIWTEALAHSYAPVNEAWLAETWGNPTTAGGYDSFYLVGADGATLYGVVNGQRSYASAASFFGPALADLLAGLPQDRSVSASAAGLLSVAGSPLAVAAARITGETGDSIPGSGAANLLVLGKSIASADMAALAGSFGLADLAYIPLESEAEPAALLRDPAGAALGKLTWTDRNPGNAALAMVRWQIILALAVLIASVSIILRAYRLKINEVRRGEEEALRTALHDELSGLPNRLMFMGLLTGILQPQPRQEDDVAVLLIDLDRFKEVNDGYGHDTGDRLIRAVADCLTVALGGRGLLCRLGGDEFSVLLRGPQALANANRVSADLLGRLERPFDIDGRIVTASGSCGIALAVEATGTAEELLRRADVAMYQAKDAGRSRSAVYDPEMDRVRNERRVLEAELRKALAQNEIKVVYQPIVDARTRRITGIEALARWIRDGVVMAPPDLFINIAERAGLIGEIGNFILDTACRQARSWPSLRLSVNVSPVQFAQPGFAASVAMVLASSGLPAERLELELTESMLIDQHDRARSIIANLRSLGVSMALDDFGTGYSSVGYLRQFKFDKLKIDRSLVMSVLDGGSGQKLIQATVLMANALNLQVTAEGVEKEEEARLLRLIGCDRFQGYLFSRPVQAADITAAIGAEAAASSISAAA